MERPRAARHQPRRHTGQAAAQLRTRHRLTAAVPASDNGVTYRDLADYDRILGLGEEAAS